jgi:hypothetical protein
MRLFGAGRGRAARAAMLALGAEMRVLARRAVSIEGAKA